MIKKEQFAVIGLDIDAIAGNAAIEWITQNTTIDTSDITKLPASAKLFILKYCELNTLSAGVSSESIEGLSQSFSTGDKAALLWDIAASLLDKWLVSPVRFVSAKKRWN